MERTGAEIVLEAFRKEGVKAVFGYPGGAVLDIFDRLYDEKEFRFILTRHEQGAAHMADGYARATGETGVVIATSGPGATNTVTGIATAFMDSIPMVIVTGQVPSTAIGNDAFQEADVTGITRPITKHNYLVKNVDELPATFKEAFHVAASGRPGPVLIDIPKDIQRAKTTVEYPDDLTLPNYKPTYGGHMIQIKKMAEAIKNAKRPVAYVGGGVITSGAADELYTFIKKTGIPVTTTLMALGAYPEKEPEALMMLGMHGTQYANYAVQKCDLLISIGARFDDRVTGKIDEFAPNAKFVHVDIDPTSISKVITADIPVVGDIKNVLEKLNPIVEVPDIKEWQEQIAQWKKDYPLAYEATDELLPQEVIDILDEYTQGEAIIATDVGQNQMWAAQHIHFAKPRRWLSSGGLGTMGYGLPGAIGAQVAQPDRQVYNISGDGGFQMNIQELTTAAINKIPVVSIVLNNSFLGMVRQWQHMFYDRRYASTCLGKNIECASQCEPEENKECPEYIPDFVQMAEACGCVGIRVSSREEVLPALQEASRLAKEEGKPTVIECIVAKEENVYPMVPAGARLDEMINSMT